MTVQSQMPTWIDQKRRHRTTYTIVKLDRIEQAQAPLVFFDFLEQLLTFPFSLHL